MSASAAKAWQVLLLVTCGFTSLQSLHCHKNRRLRNSDVLLLTTEGPDIAEPVEFNAVAERLVSQPRREASSAASSIVAFCPDKCTCDFTNDTNQLRVVCHGHFTENIPLAQLRYNWNSFRDISVQCTVHRNACNPNAYYWFLFEPVNKTRVRCCHTRRTFVVYLASLLINSWSFRKTNQTDKLFSNLLLRFSI